MRIVLVVLIAASVVASAGFDFITRDHDTVAASDSGLPIVASDFLAQDEARRVLAVRADSTGSISYSVMRTRRGDLIDSSPAQRVEVASAVPMMRARRLRRIVLSYCQMLIPMPLPI